VRPLPDAIAAALAAAREGRFFDPSDHDSFWECCLYEGDCQVGEGCGATASEAMAYAWIHCHAPEGLNDPAELVDVPPVCGGDEWSFVLTPPELDAV
jgi:hypothetical protein